uniref:Uncharacterized protein n=1 Tax=Steinernema glaseri TaxID=37863 RepID=A0A1I7YZ44_9BILA
MVETHSGELVTLLLGPNRKKLSKLGLARIVTKERKSSTSQRIVKHRQSTENNQKDVLPEVSEEIGLGKVVRGSRRRPTRESQNGGVRQSTKDRVVLTPKAIAPPVEIRAHLATGSRPHRSTKALPRFSATICFVESVKICDKEGSSCDKGDAQARFLQGPVILVPRSLKTRPNNTMGRLRRDEPIPGTLGNCLAAPLGMQKSAGPLLSPNKDPVQSLVPTCGPWAVILGL